MLYPELRTSAAFVRQSRCTTPRLGFWPFLGGGFSAAQRSGSCAYAVRQKIVRGCSLPRDNFLSGIHLAFILEYGLRRAAATRGKKKARCDSNTGPVRYLLVL